MAKKIDIIHAYRHLYRAGLKAVCYAQPASTDIRNLLRRSFRAPNATFEDRPIKRTIWFLKNAAKSTGIEHKVVRNILFVSYWKEMTARSQTPRWSDIVSPRSKKEYEHHTAPRQSLSFSPPCHLLVILKQNMDG